MSNIQIAIIVVQQQAPFMAQVMLNWIVGERRRVTCAYGQLKVLSRRRHTMWIIIFRAKLQWEKKKDLNQMGGGSGFS